MVRVRRSAFLLLLVTGATAELVSQEALRPDAAETAERIGEYVEQYYARTQSVLARETVTLQPLGRDLGFQGFARRLVYELRVEWNPSASGPEGRATVVRELLSASGPALGPPDQPDCLDPRASSPEPLAFLLPERRHKFTFRAGGPTRVGGRAAVVLDYRPVAPEPPQVVWDRHCAWIDLPGRTRGRIWADPVTSEILRFDEHLVGMVDIPASREQRRRPGAPTSFTIERADTSISYKPVVFTDPDETLLLPSEIQSLTIIRDSGIPRLRTTQTFSNYRRFVTGSRLVF